MIEETARPVPAGGARDRLGTASAFLGALGAGVGFTMAVWVLARRTLMTTPIWWDFSLWWNHALPLVFLTVAVAVAASARRWGRDASTGATPGV